MDGRFKRFYSKTVPNFEILEKRESQEFVLWFTWKTSMILCMYIIKYTTNMHMYYVYCIKTTHYLYLWNCRITTNKNFTKICLLNEGLDYCHVRSLWVHCRNYLNPTTEAEDYQPICHFWNCINRRLNGPVLCVSYILKYPKTVHRTGFY